MQRQRITSRMCVQVMILTHDKERGRISLSTKKLEPSPGDMLKNPALVFEKADEMAASFKCVLTPRRPACHVCWPKLMC